MLPRLARVVLLLGLVPRVRALLSKTHSQGCQGYKDDIVLDQTSIFIVYFDTCLRQKSPNVIQKYRNPNFCSHFRNRLVAKVGRRININFQCFCFYTMLTGVRRDFWMCLSDFALQTPKRAKSLQMGSQNAFEQPLRHCKIRYLRAFRSYFCANRSNFKQRFGASYEGLALNRTSRTKNRT